MLCRIVSFVALLAVLCGLFSCAREASEEAETAGAAETEATVAEAVELTGPARFAGSTEIFRLRTERKRSTAEELGLSLSYHSVPLPHAGKLWYLPLTEDFDPSSLVLLDASLGEEALSPADILIDEHVRDAGILPYLTHNNPVEIVILTEDAYVTCDLVFTTLPVLSIAPARRHLSREETKADFALWEPRQTGPRQLTSAASIKIRGASSSSLAKVPYKLTLLDDAGESRNLSLCGMRRDDDWVLYATHSDNTHVRDMVGWRLWRRMTESSDALTASPTGAEYVELILGEKYEGLYVLMEKVDAKTFPLDAERGDSLFKCVSWDVPQADMLARQDSRPGADSYLSMEKKFPDSAEGGDGSWSALAEYVRLCYEASGEEFAEGIGDVADIHNMLEYWLFLNISMAADNTWKNTYYANVNGRMTAYPWDLDITFGLGWNGDLANNYLWEEPGMDTRTYDFQCGRRLLKYVPGAADYVRERWEYLTLHRKADAETIIADAREFWELLHRSGAWDRNLERWPATNSTDSLDYFEATVRSREKWLSEYLPTLP